MFQKILKFSSLLLCGVTFYGCSTGWSDYYTAIMTPEEVMELKDQGKIGDVKQVDIKIVSDSEFFDKLELYKERCYYIGYSAFNGSYENPKSAREKAKSIGANTILAYVKYTNTEHGSYTYLQPTQETTYFYGNNGYGGYSGSSTTYGSVPVTQYYSTKKYDHVMGFFYCD